MSRKRVVANGRLLEVQRIAGQKSFVNLAEAGHLDIVPAGLYSGG